MTSQYQQCQAYSHFCSIIQQERQYAHFHGFNVELIAENDGVTDKAQMDARLEKGGVAGVIVHFPKEENGDRFASSVALPR